MLETFLPTQAKRAIVLFLCVWLTKPDDKRDYPQDFVTILAQNLDTTGKTQIIGFASSLGIWNSLRETPDWKWFGGVYNIIWRRSVGRPFPYPTDPIGPRLPQAP